MVRAALFGLALVAGALPPAPARHVTDGAALLRPATADRLDAKLDAYERRTGHQILVWIGDSIGDAALDDWAVRTFASWKVGRKGADDGLVLFVLARDRKLDIEVGYGLEDRVTDARAKQIIADTMAPLLRAGEPDEAVSAGVDAILLAIEGQPVGAGPAIERPAPLSTSRIVLYAILGLLLVVGIITHPRLALYFLVNILSSGGRGLGGGWSGGGGGGGGWSGGGGRSGGGGARGSW